MPGPHYPGQHAYLGEGDGLDDCPQLGGRVDSCVGEQDAGDRH